ncbi:MAG: hypothetical protein JJE51_08300 [Thermoanaerobaculia bacterium]|nr:hypothetical protein [Thermoanaerobaculia bacterium]
MRFTIEQRHLTDDHGKPLRPGAVSFHVYDGESAEDVVRIFVKKNAAEVLGDVLQFPGYQAVATMRSQAGVFTLQVTPASATFSSPGSS